MHSAILFNYNEVLATAQYVNLNSYQSLQRTHILTRSLRSHAYFITRSLFANQKNKSKIFTKFQLVDVPVLESQKPRRKRIAAPNTNLQHPI